MCFCTSFLFLRETYEFIESADDFFSHSRKIARNYQGFPSSLLLYLLSHIFSPTRSFLLIDHILIWSHFLIAGIFPIAQRI